MRTTLFAEKTIENDGNNTKKKERDSNIELLRVVLMFMIILFHLLVHACGIKEMDSDKYIETDKDMLYIALVALTCAAVNCFVFISGYYGIKFKTKTLVSFLVQAVFYSVTIYIITHLFFMEEGIDAIDLTKRFFPLTYTLWWFLNAYIGLYIISPLLEMGIKHLSKYQFGAIIILLVYLGIFVAAEFNFYASDGVSFYTVMLVYLIGRFFGEHIKVDIQKPFFKYFAICTCVFLVMYACLAIINMQALGWRISTYNNPLVILAAIFLFYGFKKLKIKSKFINKLSPLMFGVYLIHDAGDFSSYFLYPSVEWINEQIDSIPLMFLILLSITLVLFVSCALLEKLRQIICKPIVDKVYEKITTPLVNRVRVILK